jgi:outer membrane lipopolysaccharide assembly protein LptE/RlpB
LLSKQIHRFTLVLLAASLLSACGFHLRKTIVLPESLQSTAVLGVTEYSDLYLAIKNNFSFAGVSLQIKEIE